MKKGPLFDIINWGRTTFSGRSMINFVSVEWLAKVICSLIYDTRKLLPVAGIYPIQLWHMCNVLGLEQVQFGQTIENIGQQINYNDSYFQIYNPKSSLEMVQEICGV